MIYTIGYQKITPKQLLTILCGLNATLVDVRSSPQSRKAGFSRKALTALLGDGQYEWQGEGLGGRRAIDPAAIEALRARRDHVMLMCMEESPLACHRHNTICGPHFPRALHIFQGELIRAGDLAKAVADNAEHYRIHAHLDDLVPRWKDR